MTEASNRATPERVRCFTALLQDVNVLAVLLDTDARILYCNTHFTRLSGWTLPELKGRVWQEIFMTPGIGGLGYLFQDLLEDKPGAWHQENQLFTKSGKELCIRWNNMLLRDDGNVIAAGCIGEDVTERVALQSQLMEPAAAERLEIQGELHDGLGQELFGMALTAQSLSRVVERGGIATAGDLHALATAANRALDICRGVARGLAPLSEPEGGLLSALERLMRMPTGWAGPTLHFTAVELNPVRLTAYRCEQLYKIAQEALINALKHASARNITLRINVRRSRMIMEVWDDGKGIDGADAAGNGVGLKLMRHRASLLHADLHIESAGRVGTRLYLRVPVVATSEQVQHVPARVPSSA